MALNRLKTKNKVVTKRSIGQATNMNYFLYNRVKDNVNKEQNKMNNVFLQKINLLLKVINCFL